MLKSLTPILRFLLIGFLFSWGACFLLAEENPLESVTEPIEAVENTAQTGDGKVLQPRTLDHSIYSGDHSDSSLMLSVVLFLVMLCAILGFWYYSKKGGMGMSLKKMAMSSELRIRETKSLGNRQFLVVVEYGEQRMLLGVAPGMINHLCYLEASEPELAQDPKSES